MVERKKESDLICYISHNDIEIIRNRIPKEYKSRLRDVFIHHESFGVRILGPVQKRGRRDINLNSLLPYRVSLRRFIYKGQSPKEFGATPRGQWTPWAVRRFLLYDVFLHELGHLQIVNPKSSNYDRKFASETLAQRFADNLRKELFSSGFDHPDPIHNPPKSDELEIIKLWQKLNKKQRFRLVELTLNAPYKKILTLREFGEINDLQETFLIRALCF